MVRPYYSLNEYFKEKFGEKCYKVPVDAGCTCPNRDGSLDTGGCIFCSAGGSGDFAIKISDISNEALGGYLDNAINCYTENMNKEAGNKFMIYFQAFTNTYGDIDYLKSLWLAALYNERVIGISIATRPDCLPDTVMLALSEVKKYADSVGKLLWVELGLQTIHRESEAYIRRHFPLSVYDEACKKMQDLKLPFIVHVILGLPNETHEMMLETVSYVCRSDIRPFGIKLQLLHVLKGTDLEADYRDGKFEVMTLDEYADLVCDILEIIPKEIVIHRLTGDGPKKILIAPEWSGNKKQVLNHLHGKMRERGTVQGSLA